MSKAGEDVLAEGELVLLTPRERLALVVLRRAWAVEDDDGKGCAVLISPGPLTDAQVDALSDGVISGLGPGIIRRLSCECGKESCKTLLHTREEWLSVAPFVMATVLNAMVELASTGDQSTLASLLAKPH